MPNLTAAHRGYEYQDLLAAARLVDMMLGTIVTVHVDEKLLPDDRFDDLTTIDATAHRERTQFKHTENEDQPLTLATFASDARSLRLDRLIAIALADRDGPGAGAKEFTFRVVLRDTRPVDRRLLAVLGPANPDPGPLLPGMQTFRMRFDPNALWKGTAADGAYEGGDANPFLSLREGASAIEFADLEWVCARLVIEVEAPLATRDLTAPGPAEQLLIDRLRREIGAELYPNADRSAVDVAEAVIRTARSARQGGVVVTPAELLRRTQLRHDFGAVARAHPVEKAVEVARTVTVDELVEAVDTAADDGHPVLVLGPPGQGKSWVCQQVIDELTARHWLVSEHYCYLGDADGDRLPRVLVESVFGSLLARLADADPRLVAKQRPRLAADEQALADAVARALEDQPDRRVALVVDGIDHVTRVRGGGPTFDPSFTLAEALSSLALPPGSVLVVLSQPGAHLRPLEEAGGTTVQVPGLTDAELGELAGRLGVIPPGEGPRGSRGASAPSLLVGDDIVGEFLTALSERSAGNALYATYLCREALRRPATVASPSAIVRSLPPFDGSLQNYYQYVHAALGDQGAWVADVIALLDFPITRIELKEIRPDMAHRVDDALDVLAPVLSENAVQGGVRVYHESFARFLRRPFQNAPTARVALLDHIATWLTAKGMFDDSRAFRSLLTVLADASHDREVVERVSHDFVIRAVAAGFPASAIMKNLATAIGCAARVDDWPAVVRYVEMARAAATYQEERFETTLVDFIDVAIALQGKDVVANQLLHDGRPVMAARAGLQMCAAADALGVVAPWREYMTASLREAESDNTSYSEASNKQIELAWLRGRLRFSSITHSATPRVEPKRPPGTPDDDTGAAGDVETDFGAPIAWNRLADYLEHANLPVSGVVDAIVQTYGFPAVTNLIEKLDHPGVFCIAVAEDIMTGRLPDTDGSAHFWASESASHGLPPGNVHRLIALGVDVDLLAVEPVAEARTRLVDLTREVQDRSVRWETERLDKWLDGCAVAARRDPLGLGTAEALIAGPGWYPCWLSFTVALVRAEAAPASDQSHLSLAAMQLLTEDLNPFSGSPRACDLYPIRGVIDATIRRAVALLSDEDWGEALHLLDDVSAAITTTLSGAMNGPFPRDSLLRLAVETATATRYAAAEALVRNEIENGADGRYYADLAEYRLLGARLALTADDRAEANRLWIEACQMLTAYGWRKDITIYELLDPLPTLISADPARGRACVAQLQPLCERVPMHTDGSETRGAWERWWDLLAAADPIALARLTAPALLSKCNLPNSLLHDARSELWRAWHHRVDPIVAASLRLTLEEPLDPADPAALDALAEITDGTGADLAARLMTLLLARSDERPVRYGVSNSDELVDRDTEWVDALNSVADRARVPRVAPILTTTSEDRPSSLPYNPSSLPVSSGQVTHPMALFAPGAVGLARAIRAWRSRPYDKAGPDWTRERFANILGYRIVELAEAGREEDAAAALGFVADATGFGDRSGLLHILAEGLERNHLTRLATLAYTLAWTRARGHGGWLTFGGETEIVALRRAAALDQVLTLKTIAQEIEQIISRGRYGTYGISQALIYGFAVGGLGSSPSSGLDVAFLVWKEAFTVIAGRAPKVDPADDPDVPYTPPEPDEGGAVPDDLTIAFTIASLAGLTHAAREQKRRSLVAAEVLLHERPIEASDAFNTAFLTLSDPATLMWLLRMLERAGAIAKPVIGECTDALTELAGSPHLTVRALARRLLGNREPPPPPPAEADPALLRQGPSGLWIPPAVAPNEDDLTGPNELVEAVAGARLSRAEALLPGLGDAVQRRVSTDVVEKGHKKRLQRQLDAYGDRSEKRWPDAYLAQEEAVEDALQRAAAGGRAARLAHGLLVSDPVKWEDQLATALLDDPAVPVALEGTRYPRPDMAPPPQRGDPVWSALRARAQGHPTGDAQVEAADMHGGLLLGTLTVAAPETAPVWDAGRFRGWRQLAAVERRIYPPPNRNGDPDCVAVRLRAVELRDSGDFRNLTLPPVAAGDLGTWTSRFPSGVSQSTPKQTWPIVGYDSEAIAAGDARCGLGIQAPLLSPIPWVIVTLGLRPGALFVLDDDLGPALALVTWRTEYETGAYHLAWPRLRGAAIVIRHDLFDQLLGAIPGRFKLRDFVSGDVGLCS
ncbi:MAG: AAA family ATPase [Blastocatellia bacterium]